MRLSFIPIEAKFFDYFHAATLNLLEAASLLENLFEDLHDVSGVRAQIDNLEHCGDQIVHDVTNMLVRTLVTPFSSDEIHHLTNAVDDALDTIHTVAVRLSIYQVTETRPHAQRLAHLIARGAIELDSAMQGLQDKKLYPQVRDRIVRIHTVENEADDVLEAGLRDLTAQHEDIFDFIRWKEIYELLEQCTDRLEDAGDVLQRMILSNA